MTKFFAFLLLVFLGSTSFAQREVFVFVSTNASQPLIVQGDLESNEEQFQRFQGLVATAHIETPMSEFPRFLQLQLNTLQELEPALHRALVDDEKVKMVFLAGHGNALQFHLNDISSYDGQEVGRILGSPKLKSVFASDLAVYFGACLCGNSLDSSNFQVRFMKEFKAQNELLPTRVQTRTLVSLAHRFLSYGVHSLKTVESSFSTMLYQRGVLSVVNRLEMLVFKTLGRDAMPRTSIFAGAFVGATVALAAFAGPEFAKSVLLVSSLFTGVAVAKITNLLKYQNSLLAQRMIYDSANPNELGSKATVDTVSALTGLREMLSKQTCEGLLP